MKQRIYELAVILLLLPLLLWADGPGKPLSQETQTAILKARIKSLDADGKVKDINAQASALQLQWSQLQAQAQQAVADQTKAKQELESLEDKAYQEAGLTKDKYDFNPTTLEFLPKATPAPSSPPPPAKK